MRCIYLWALICPIFNDVEGVPLQLLHKSGPFSVLNFDKNASSHGNQRLSTLVELQRFDVQSLENNSNHGRPHRSKNALFSKMAIRSPDADRKELLDPSFVEAVAQTRDRGQHHLTDPGEWVAAVEGGFCVNIPIPLHIPGYFLHLTFEGIIPMLRFGACKPDILGFWGLLGKRDKYTRI